MLFAIYYDCEHISPSIEIYFVAFLFWLLFKPIYVYYLNDLTASYSMRLDRFQERMTFSDSILVAVYIYID